jgi:hypothetical protein
MVRWLLLVILLTVIFSGCNLRSADVENAIDTPTNELELYDFQIGYAKGSVINRLGDPELESDNHMVFKHPTIFTGIEDQKLAHIVTSDSNFGTDEGITIGSSKTDVLSAYSELDLYFYNNNGEEWLYYFYGQGVKVAFKLIDDSVQVIATGTSPLYHLFNYESYDEMSESFIPDEDIISLSDYLTFKENTDINNEKVMDQEFLQYASLGLIKGVPIPIGMQRSEVARRYKQADSIEYDGIFGAEYWYKRFNASIVVNEEEIVKMLKLPIEIKEEELLQYYNHQIIEENGVRIIELDGYMVTFYPSEAEQGVYTDLIISENKPE